LLTLEGGARASALASVAAAGFADRWRQYVAIRVGYGGKNIAGYTIPRFFGFLIVPVSYHPGGLSPPLHYSRLLEAGVWRT
jgi:hypothetical protein